MQTEKLSVDSLGFPTNDICVDQSGCTTVKMDSTDSRNAAQHCENKNPVGEGSNITY